MKISHESPLSLLATSRQYNDYDYALVHLFEEIPEYYDFFVESLKQGRKVLLDNSIFELGTAFDAAKFAEWVNKLKPSEYIIPDALEDCLQTMDNALEWKEKYWLTTPKNSKAIGVVQGKSYEDLVNCYQYLDDVIKVDKIAISFDYTYYQQVCPHPNKWMAFTIGRVQTLTKMLNDGIINTDKPHHLLGCALPIEFMFYRDFKWIETMDTSNPVVHGLLGIKYEHGGMDNKQSIKLVDLIRSVPNNDQMRAISENMSKFRSYVTGVQE
jgi:hypothetical protein